MNLFNIEELLPYVIEAYTHVYGEEYRQLINDRVNNACINVYEDIVGLNDYVSYLLACKKRELAIRFLEAIGEDFSFYGKDNYSERLDEKTNSIISNYFSLFWAFDSNYDYRSPLLCFNIQEYGDNEKIILSNKISLINYLLGENHEKITEANFDDFSKTDEYAELLNKINIYLKVYNNLLQEYLEFEKSLLPYKEYVWNERKRYYHIMEEKEYKIFDVIYPRLSPDLKAALFHYSREQQKKIILGDCDLESEFCIENLFSKNMSKLASQNIAIWIKKGIINRQIEFFNDLGLPIPDIKIETEEDIKRYLEYIIEYIKSDSIKNVIPSDELIDLIKKLRKKEYEDFLREYYTTRDDFIRTKENIIKYFSPENVSEVELFELIYYKLKNKIVCVHSCYQNIKENDAETILPKPVMFISVCKNAPGGLLADAFIHEIGHIIDCSFRGFGFDQPNDLIDELAFKNENGYDKRYRKYERFNETLNDIFKEEAKAYLNKQGVYLIERKEFTSLNSINYNTTKLVKDLLKPLLDKFRKQVIAAKVNSNSSHLTDYIGRDNFEELVDALNKVDYLVNNGLELKMKDSPSDSMVLEYQEQLDRINQIYKNIDAYYAEYLCNSLGLLGRR